MNEEQRLHILERLHQFETKDQQDIYLQRLITATAPKQVKKLNNKQPKSSSYKYFVIVQNERKEVCKLAFESLHGISHKCVYRLCKLLSNGMIPQDKRGKSRSGNTIPPATCFKIHEHIK